MKNIHTLHKILLSACIWLLSAATARADIASTICDIYNNELVSGLGPGIATMAVIGLSISATQGRASMGMAVMVAAGIAILFNAGEVAGAFGISGC